MKKVILSEKALEKKCRQYAADRGYIVWKMYAFNQKGVPDRIFIGPHGRVFFVEFKKPGGKLSAWQEFVAGELEKRSLAWYCIDNLEDFVNLID